MKTNVENINMTYCLSHVIATLYDRALQDGHLISPWRHAFTGGVSRVERQAVHLGRSLWGKREGTKWAAVP